MEFYSFLYHLKIIIIIVIVWNTVRRDFIFTQIRMQVQKNTENSEEILNLNELVKKTSIL